MRPPNFRCTGQKSSLPRLMFFRFRSEPCADISARIACSTMAGFAASSWVTFRWKSVHSAGTPIIAVTCPDSSTSPSRSVVSSSR